LGITGPATVPFLEFPEALPEDPTEIRFIFVSFAHFGISSKSIPKSRVRLFHIPHGVSVDDKESGWGGDVADETRMKRIHSPAQHLRGFCRKATILEEKNLWRL
jgi:hypothetical protein